MLWGISGDPAFDSLRRELRGRGVPQVALDQRQVRRARFELDTCDGLAGRLELDGDVIDIDEIGAIFVRPFDIRQVVRESADLASSAEGRDEAVTLQQRLFAWTEISDVVVLNRPSAMASNCSKPYQAELIRRSGFEIPPTLVTTTPDDARDFIARYDRVIYKSVSDSRSMVSRVGATELAAIQDVANCPTQFQARIAGTDWRVHVVGDDVYACEIECEADDYRCAEAQGFALEIRSAPLPEPIAARCHGLAHSLNLPLAGIDLRRTVDDEWYCFEVNPAPAFTYYEQETGQPLAAAVAQLLSAGLPS